MKRRGTAPFGVRLQGRMSRLSGMSSGKRRAWGVGLVLFFVVMIGMIAWSQWYATHVNVPRYQAENARGNRR